MIQEISGGYVVKWEVYDDLAEQAVQDVVDEGFEWVDERNRREVDTETARQVRERYSELVEAAEEGATE